MPRRVRWKAPELLPGSGQPVVAARLAVAAKPVIVESMVASERMESPRFDATQPRRCLGSACAGAETPLLENVELTPGGRRKHTLQRRSPHGTTRTSQYISPSRAEIMEETGFSDEEGNGDERGMEQFRRRGVAVEETACQQSGKERSARAREKRKAGEAAV